jgi:nitronate monooxygenase
MGADLAYMGTRFINTLECLADDEYKKLITDVSASDIVYTPAISGVHANFIRQSIESAGLDLATLEAPKHIDFGAELEEAREEEKSSDAKPWKNIWSAGHGVGSITDTPTTNELIMRLKSEDKRANEQQLQKSGQYR